MGLSVIFAIGIATAAFVGINIGGSSTGVAFGPATGSDVLSMRQAAALMTVFFLLGGATFGRNVVDTLGTEFVPPSTLTIERSIAVLVFIGLAILLGNVLKVSVSTSETAVVAFVGLGIAVPPLYWDTVGHVVMWWFVSPILAFWLTAFIGRYFYDDIVAWLDLSTGRRSRLGHLLVIGIGCYMAFSAGASNTANAVAPLVGSDLIGMNAGILLAAVAVGAGAFLLGPRTMETVGEEITDLSMEASLVVNVIAATIITGLSWGGIPASLAITLTSCVIGLGWGRASQSVPIMAILRPEGLTDAERAAWRDNQLGLFDPRTVRRVVAAWLASPVIAGVAAFVFFSITQRLHLLG